MFRLCECSSLHIRAQAGASACRRCCLVVGLMLHVSHPRPGPIPRQAGSEVGGQRLSTRSQAAPDRRSFLTMVAHAPVAAMAAEGSATAERAGNGAAPAQLDGSYADEYPTIEHQVWPLE